MFVVVLNLKLFLRGLDSWTQPLPPRPLGAEETLKCGELKGRGFGGVCVAARGGGGVTKVELRRGGACGGAVVRGCGFCG